MAVVEPAPDWQTKHIRLPISRRPDALGRYCIDDSGRACDTEAEVAKRQGKRALLT